MKVISHSLSLPARTTKAGPILWNKIKKCYSKILCKMRIEIFFKIFFKVYQIWAEFYSRD